MSTWTVMNIKGQGHSLTFIQGHSDWTFSNFFCSETARPIKAKFHMEPPWDVRNEKVFKCSRSHYPAYIWWKTSKIFFLGTKRPMTLKLGIQHQVLKVLPMFSYVDPGLTLTIFTTGSNLFPNASAWVTAYTALSANVFPSLLWFNISPALRWAMQDQWSSGFVYCDDHLLFIWAASRQNQQNDCAPSEDSDLPTWASAQSDQSLRCALSG